MSAKTPIFLFLGMCLSFSLVLAVIIAFRPQPSPPKRRPLPAVQTRAPLQPEPQSRTAPAPPGPAAKAKAEAAPLSAALKPMDLTPSAEVAQLLDQTKKELRQQIAQLKKDRDQMLNNLADQLATMSADEATTQLNALDDEAAGLVLVRLKPDKRQALLKHLEPGRASRLSQALTPPPR